MTLGATGAAVLWAVGRERSFGIPGGVGELTAYRAVLPLDSDLLDSASEGATVNQGQSLMRIDDTAQGICDELGKRLARFQVYRVRLSDALGRALTGERDYVADNLDSYHTVWFQFHEDLLVTLGISRDEERRDLSAAG